MAWGMWGRLRASRSAHIALIGGLVTGIVATTAVDVAVAGQRRSDAHRLAAHRRLVQQQDAYLRSLRTVAAHVRQDVLPVQHILDVLRTPHAGDVYAARDALAGNEAHASLRADARRLDALAAPPGWRSSQQGLRGAVRAMTDVTATMRTRDKVKDPVALNSDLIDIDDAALVSAELDWQKALRATFARRHQKAPATPQTGSARHPVATLSGWTFAADRSCFAGMLHSQPYLRRLDQRDTDTAAMRAGATILRRTAKQLQGLDRPSRTATLRREVLLRLPSVLATADAIRDVANGIDRLDLTALNSAVDRLHTLLPQIKVLGGGFRSLHVTACATFFGSKDVSGSSGRSLAA